MSKAPSPRPLSVKVIIGWYVFMFILDLSTMVEGLAPLSALGVRGFASTLFGVFTLVLGCYLIVGVWRLWELARKVAIGYACFLLLAKGAIIAVAGGHVAYIGAVAVGCAAQIFILWFLVKRKSAFVKPAQAV